MLQNFKLIKAGADVTPLLSALDREQHLFDQITARQNAPGSPHADTKAIFLRWAKSQTIEAAFTEIPAIEYPALEALPEARALIAEVVQAVGAKELGRVLITALKPGGKITRHADEGMVADHYERFHVALQSDDHNLFFSYRPDGTGEVVHMKAGQIWWFNHKRDHELSNASDRVRIHLIVDCVAPEYRKERDAISA